MRVSAYLRQPAEVSQAEKDDYVEEILELLELQDLADAMIGFPGFGLSVESRKRLTIGVELASKPQLLLFLDEPTTGLDGQSAYNIVRFLKKLAGAGQAILCTIHQPNAVLFENFDRLLLLQKGGRSVYHGPIGKGSRHLLDYLERGGAKIAENENPAEAMLDVIGAGSRKRVGNEDWADKWNRSEELNKEALARNEEIPDNLRKEYSTPFMYQLKVSAPVRLSFFFQEFGAYQIVSRLTHTGRPQPNQQGLVEKCRLVLLTVRHTRHDVDFLDCTNQTTNTPVSYLI
jgi:ATP-binding cassette subfamily G (WHITE) protein 2 (SNQ2)